MGKNKKTSANVELKTCARCKKQAQKLKSLDTTTQEKLSQKGHSALSSGEYCDNCIIYVMNEAYSTVLEKRVRIEQDRRKANLWASRLPYYKLARESFQKKEYANAVQNYLSYLMVLEKVLEVGSAEIEPKHFRSIKGEKERSLIAMVYFDLLRIYDKDERSYEKFKQAIEKLILFTPNIAEGKNITKTIKKYSRSKEAIHKKDIQKLLKQLKKYYGTAAVSSGCFIATAVYGDPNCYQVLILRHFRNYFLNKTWITKKFVDFYYLVSPFFVETIKKNAFLKVPIRLVLDFFIKAYKLFILSK